MERFIMNTVKRLKKSNLQSWQKKRCFGKKNNNNRRAMIITILLVSLIGTYLDLIFVGKQMYTFPIRPFPDVFTINIAFTLIILPIFTAVFLQIAKRLRPLLKVIFILLIGLVASLVEQVAEKWGYFTHSASWDHSYSFFGYSIFLFLIYQFYRWLL
ncbi:CBO0543 family protein [Scopulibacillus cellulosilyticus]|uniref:CBO0543 family protein n=1 Tax=Scopulibacillus cellulosilyticus TaxID=2665665 RepID=A0ABW2PQR8_9BACL